MSRWKAQAGTYRVSARAQARAILDLQSAPADRVWSRDKIGSELEILTKAITDQIKTIPGGSWLNAPCCWT